MLCYKGATVSKKQLAHKMLRHDTDPDKGYVGDPFTTEGWTIYPPALMDLVKKYRGHSINLTGAAISALEEVLYNGKPIVVWVSPMHGFTVHALVLTGYDEKYFYYNDPWTGRGNTRLSKSTFQTLWSNQSKRALSY